VSRSLYAGPAGTRRQQRPARRLGLSGDCLCAGDVGATKAQWRTVAEQLWPKLPKLIGLMSAAKPDVLAYMSIPKDPRTKLHSTNPIEWLNDENKRWIDIVGISPDKAVVTRVIGAI
jgi:putative transposase